MCSPLSCYKAQRTDLGDNDAWCMLVNSATVGYRCPLSTIDPEAFGGLIVTRSAFCYVSSFSFANDSHIFV